MTKHSTDEEYEGHEISTYELDNGNYEVRVRADNFDGEWVYKHEFPFWRVAEFRHRAEGFIDGMHDIIGHYHGICVHGDEDEVVALRAMVESHHNEWQTARG